MKSVQDREITVLLNLEISTVVDIHAMKHIIGVLLNLEISTVVDWSYASFVTTFY